MENLWGVRTVRRGTQVGSLRGLGLFTAAAALTVSGCATAKLGQAVELSANGTQASGKLLNAAQTVETAFHTSVKSDQFLRALQSSTVPSGSGCSLVIPGTPEPIATEPSGPPSDALKKTATALRARTQLAGALGKTYSGMNALASYDARGSVQAGLSSVFEATNAFRESQGLATVPSEISILVPAIGGAIAQNRQVSMLKQASAHLRTALAAYREALSVSRTGAVSVLQDEISERYSLQIALWRRGYLDANGLLAAMGESSKLTVPAPEAKRFIAEDEALCRGVRAALEQEREELKTAVADEFDAQIKIIDELVAAHEKFEKGAGMDVTHLAALLDELTALATKIKGSEGNATKE